MIGGGTTTLKKKLKEVIPNSKLKADMCRQILESGVKKEYDTIRHSYTNSRLNGCFNECKQNNISPTLDTRCDCIGVVVLGNYSPSNHEASRVIDEDGLAPTFKENHGTINAVLIKNNNSKGYLEANEGDGIDISSRMQHHRGTVQKGKAQTLSTMGGENVGVVVNDR